MEAKGQLSPEEIRSDTGASLACRKIASVNERL